MKDNSLQAKDRIILPLDFPSFEDARPFIQSLRDHIGLFKIGLTLFVNEGLQVVKKVEEIAGDSKIFLDLKLYDTPWQVGGASSALVSGLSEIRFVTIHASGGCRVVRAAVDAMKGRTEILGVTVLTSQSEGEPGTPAWQGSVEERVIALARIAKEAGAAGVVASAHEASNIRKSFRNDFIIVTPGIRPSWSQVSKDDQRRMKTPGQAVSNGADYVVVGRPIYQDKDPIGAAKKIAEEIEAVL